MRRLPSLALAAVLAAAPVYAQANPCATKAPKLPAAGGWSEYQADSGDFRLLYLGHETAGERIEMTATRTMRNGQAGHMVMQVVVDGWPYEMTEAKEVVMQMGDNPPMKMSEQMLAMMRSRMPANREGLTREMCGRMAEVGTESVTVPAGTFRTTHYRDTQGGADVWISQDVPFGMVKAVSAQGTIQLKAKGTGGASQVHGTPQEMGPGMMGPRGGRRP